MVFLYHICNSSPIVVNIVSSLSQHLLSGTPILTMEIPNSIVRNKTIFPKVYGHHHPITSEVVLALRARASWEGRCIHISECKIHKLICFSDPFDVNVTRMSTTSVHPPTISHFLFRATELARNRGPQLDGVDSNDVLSREFRRTPPRQ